MRVLINTVDISKYIAFQGFKWQRADVDGPNAGRSVAIISWEIDGETVETVSDFIFGGSKITADGDCSHEIKRRLLLGRKVMTNVDSRDITLPY